MRQLLHNPILITLLCLPLSALLLPLLKRRRVARSFQPVVLAFLAIGAGGPILSAAGHMIYHDEPTILSVAAAALHGQPLYLAPGSPDLYSLLYGPATYWVYMPPMLAHIHDLRFYQLWVILPLALAACLMLRIVRRADSRVGAAFALLPYALTVILQSPNEWAMKGDAWILLFLTLELQLSLEAPAAIAVLAMPICIALLINLKVTTAVLAAVPLAILARRLGPRPTLLAALLAVLLTPLPFRLPGVSATNFLFWLRLSTHHGINRHLALENAALVVFMALPCVSLFSLWLRQDLASARAWLHSERVALLGTLAATLVAAITGAKVGAGPWHCAPLAPIFAWWTATLWQSLNPRPTSIALPSGWRLWLANLVLAQCLLALLQLRSTVLLHLRGDTPGRQPPAHRVAEDLLAIVHAHPHTQIAMGYGGNASYEVTWQRPLLVLLGNHYSLDADALNENDLAGIPLSNATLDNLRHCAASIILIPRNDEPFSMQNLYVLDGAPIPPNLFPTPFRQQFLHYYIKTSTSSYFDLWSCTP